MPTCLPTIVRRCHACASERFRTNGMFRVNAHHKLLDAWLLALCTRCGDTTKLTVFERTNVRSVPRGMLDRLHHNDAVLAAELLQDPVLLRRNRIALDWDGAWRLYTSGSHDQAEAAVVVSVRFAAPVPVRPVRLIADGLGLSRAETERLVADGSLVSSVRLTGRRSGDFTFTLERRVIVAGATGRDPRPTSAASGHPSPGTAGDRPVSVCLPNLSACGASTTKTSPTRSSASAT